MRILCGRSSWEWWGRGKEAGIPDTGVIREEAPQSRNRTLQRGEERKCHFREKQSSFNFTDKEKQGSPQLS